MIFDLIWFENLNFKIILNFGKMEKTVDSYVAAALERSNIYRVAQKKVLIFDSV
jgi:hypothetical protein